MNQNQLNDATAPRSVDRQQACSGLWHPVIRFSFKPAHHGNAGRQVGAIYAVERIWIKFTNDASGTGSGCKMWISKPWESSDGGNFAGYSDPRLEHQSEQAARLYRISGQFDAVIAYSDSKWNEAMTAADELEQATTRFIGAALALCPNKVISESPEIHR